MLYNISCYLVLGVIFAIIVEYILSKTAIEEYQINSNQERILVILIWPIFLLSIGYNLIRILIEGPNDDDYRNML
jgi:hypothetical protein